VEPDQTPNDKTTSLLNHFKTKILKPSEELKEVDLMKSQEERSHWLVQPRDEVFKELL